ncbi:hypothetical protein [Streptomyces sp. NPDC053367]|uniref:hypothetical protein n=1 Tax=Streptomyces sp. NPDC053367 TaxID=3365700 RepID=UPI0037D5A449
MTHRKTASTITDAELDQLYNDLAALREVARGYCPECGRGDASPTAQQWLDQRLRADQAEELLAIAHDTSNKSEAARACAVQRAERAEAAIARVRALADVIAAGAPWTANLDETAHRIREALDGPTPLTGADGRIICTCTYGTPCGCGTSVHYQHQEPTR